MITLSSLPADYRPLERLTVCGNVIEGGGFVVSVGDALPVLFGRGLRPTVWVQAAIDPSARGFVTVVVASVSLHPAVAVRQDEDRFVVSVGSTVVLRMKQHSDAEAEVDMLDLRPLGVDVRGDAQALHAGGLTFAHNSFKGTGPMLAMDPGALALEPLDPDALAGAFGLTSAEAHLAIQLAEGRSISEIAEDRGVSMTTMRSHLRSLFEKTATNRQAELVRLVYRFRDIGRPPVTKHRQA